MNIPVEDVDSEILEVSTKTKVKSEVFELDDSDGSSDDYNVKSGKLKRELKAL